MIALRVAQSQDAARLTEIAGAAKAHWGYPRAWLDAWRDVLTITPAFLTTAWVRVAVGDGCTVGFIAVEEVAGRCEVTHLWLAPHTMRVGVGRALIEAALAHAAARTAPPLEVEADPHAAPFYERLGFARVGTVPAPMPGDARRVLVALRFAR